MGERTHLNKAADKIVDGLPVCGLAGGVESGRRARGDGGGSCAARVKRRVGAGWTARACAVSVWRHRMSRATMDPDSVDTVGATNLTQFVMQHSGDKELAMMMSAVRV